MFLRTAMIPSVTFLLRMDRSWVRVGCLALSFFAGAVDAHCVERGGTASASIFLALDAESGFDGDYAVAHAGFRDLVARAARCGREDNDFLRPSCVVTVVLTDAEFRPVPEPSRAQDSSVVGLLSNRRGSCSALAALTLDVARAIGVRLSTIVLRDHVLLATSGSRASYFEPTERGRDVSLEELTNRFSRGQPVPPPTALEEYVGVYLDNLAVRRSGELGADAAEPLFRRAVGLAPRTERVRFNFGTFLLETGRADEAVTHLRKAVRLDPADDAAWTNLGWAQLRTGAAKQAIRSFERAHQINPSAARAAEGLAQARALVGSTPKP